MTTGAPSATARRRNRFLPSLSPFAVAAVTLIILFGGTGLAYAANGGNFVLGRSNSESATASLSNSRGVPLSLSASRGHAPLAVNRTTMVSNLNAQYTGGLTATQLQSSGGDGFTQPGTNTPIGSTSPLVAGTGNLPAGIYYVTATADVIVQQADGGAVCYIDKGSNRMAFSASEVGQPGLWSLAETAAVSVKSGDTLQEHCAAGGNNGSVAVDAGITAIRIRSSEGTPPARTGVPAAELLPRPARAASGGQQRACRSGCRGVNKQGR
jgi:hypothetical protein